VMDDGGEVIEEFPFTNDGEGMRYLLEFASSDSKAVIESTGNLWLRIYEALEAKGVEVKLANPVKTWAMALARIKTANHDEPYILNSGLSSFSSVTAYSFFKRRHTTIRGPSHLSQSAPTRRVPYSSAGETPQSVFQGASS
jgi:hypothetical protein